MELIIIETRQFIFLNSCNHSFGAQLALHAMRDRNDASPYYVWSKGRGIMPIRGLGSKHYKSTTPTNVTIPLIILVIFGRRHLNSDSSVETVLTNIKNESLESQQMSTFYLSLTNDIWKKWLIHFIFWYPLPSSKLSRGSFVSDCEFPYFRLISN